MLVVFGRHGKLSHLSLVVPLNFLADGIPIARRPIGGGIAEIEKSQGSICLSEPQECCHRITRCGDVRGPKPAQSVRGGAQVQVLHGAGDGHDLIELGDLLAVLTFHANRNDCGCQHRVLLHAFIFVWLERLRRRDLLVSCCEKISESLSGRTGEHGKTPRQRHAVRWCPIGVFKNLVQDRLVDGAIRECLRLDRSAGSNQLIREFRLHGRPLVAVRCRRAAYSKFAM